MSGPVRQTCEQLDEHEHSNEQRAETGDAAKKKTPVTSAIARNNLFVFIAITS
jgi:hypothetical protein